jgi:hypothetical protein
MEINIGDKTYTVYETIGETPTGQILAMYEILNDILTDDIVETMKDKKDLVRAISKLMFTQARVKICACMIKEAVSESDLMKATKDTTDKIMLFFSKSFLPVMIAEQISLVTAMLGTEPQEKAAQTKEA